MNFIGRYKDVVYMKSEKDFGTPLKSLEDYGVKKRLSYIQKNGEIDDKIILDMGVGYGLYSSKLIERSGAIYGIDIVKQNLFTSRENVGSNKYLSVLGSVNQLPFVDNSIDLIICIETYEHLENGLEVLNEMHRVLKNGGRLIITVPNKLFPFETHGIKLGNKNISSLGLGFPLLSYLPNFMRQIFATVQIYTPWDFERILIASNFRAEKHDFFMPNFDVLNKNISKLSSIIKLLAKLSDVLEKTPLKVFGMTIVYIATREDL